MVGVPKTKLGQYLRDARKEKKMTQGDVGEKLGVNATIISSWELGVDDPGKNYHPGLIRILGVEEKDFKKTYKITVAERKLYVEGNSREQLMNLENPTIEKYFGIIREKYAKADDVKKSHMIRGLEAIVEDGELLLIFCGILDADKIK